MPISAPKPCTTCGTLVRDGSARCMAHKAPVWLPTHKQAKRITGRRLQAMRAALFAAEPTCRECATHGRVALAMIRDHIKPLAEGGLDVDSNVQPLCQDCSDAKTASESARGRGRGVGLPPSKMHHPNAPGGVSKPAPRQPETDRLPKFLGAQVLGVGGVDLGPDQLTRSAG